MTHPKDLPVEPAPIHPDDKPATVRQGGQYRKPAPPKPPEAPVPLLTPEPDPAPARPARKGS
jgi:hypothetical protein